MYKRFQYYAKEGKLWSRWYFTTETPHKWQLKNVLLNEYREEPPEEEKQN